MDDQYDESNDLINQPNVPPEILANRQRRENRLAIERGAPPPFPNVANIPQQPDGLRILSARQHEVNRQYPLVFSLLSRYEETPDLPLSAQHFRDNLRALLYDEQIPWPMRDIDGLPELFADHARAAVEEIRSTIYRLEDERLLRIPRDNAPNTPGWILSLFPDTQPVGQRNADGNPICPICIQQLPPRVSITRPCNHRFCPECLEEWLRHAEESNPPAKCPICFVVIERIGNNGELGHRVGEFLGWNFERQRA